MLRLCQLILVIFVGDLIQFLAHRCRDRSAIQASNSISSPIVILVFLLNRIMDFLGMTSSTLVLILGFIDLSYTVTVLHESKLSLCDFHGRDYPCTTPFANIMQGAKVTVTSSCGDVLPDDICPHWKYFSSGHPKDCLICDSDTKSSLYSVKSLSDPFNQFNNTCWFSGPIYNQHNLNSVNISVAFNKRFEVYYVAMQFCTEIPDSITIYKSSDYGFSWTPWQYYSKNCQKAFNMPPTQEFPYPENQELTLDPTCIDLNHRPKDSNLGQSDSILPFSTTIGKKLNESLINWITITDLRITFTRFDDQMPAYFDYGKYFYLKHRRGRDILNMTTFSINERSMSKMYYGLSDLSIGGRCQCHGHSNRCIINDDNRIVCDCKHNTDGLDCDKCKEGYFDLPWARATKTNANSCKRCHCNLHSQHCQFDQNVYMATGQVSGGVCHKCLHNTAGRQCHYCEDGYYRDWTKPLSHDLSCLKCKCNSVGSANVNTCDKKLGQCFCKEGVSGKRCDKCKPGYTQTRSIHRPCIKNYDMMSNPLGKKPELNSKYQYMPNTESECKPCDEKRKRIRFKKFCRRDSVFMGTIQSKEVHGKMVRFELQIKEVWRVSGKMVQFISPHSQDHYSIPLWITHEEVRCECPSIYLGRSYLILMKHKVYLHRQREELLLDLSTVMLQWRPSWQRRLLKFKLKSENEKCERFLSKKSKIKNNRIFRMSKSSRSSPN